MKLILKYTAVLLLVLFALMLLIANTRLYYKPEILYQNNHIFNQDIQKQLAFLKVKIHAKEAEKMQDLFPEGFVFFNVIYGLTWCEFIANLDTNSAPFKEGLSEIDWSFNQVNSTMGKLPFNANLPLEYGAFYNGWTTYLLGKKIQLLPKNQRKKQEIELFSLKCNQMADAFFDNAYLESYPSATWQADNLVCIASLALYDKVIEDKYSKTVHNFIDRLKADLSPQTGLIPHSKDSQKARGSSQSLINVFLPEIDSAFGKEIFKKYKNNFLDSKYGLVGIREYPKGVSGEADIDSGPVIDDIGGVASIVGIKAMAIHGDFATAIALRNNIETFGFPINFGHQKKYLGGILPMADAFIAWANVTNIQNESIKNANSNTIFHLISSVLILLIFWILFVFLK